MWLWVYMHLYTCVCVSVECLCRPQVNARFILSVFLNCPPTYFLKQSLSLTWASLILLHHLTRELEKATCSSSSDLGLQAHHSLCLAFYVGVEYLNSGSSHLHSEHFTTASSPQAISADFLFKNICSCISWISSQIYLSLDFRELVIVAFLLLLWRVPVSVEWWTTPAAFV